MSEIWEVILISLIVLVLVLFLVGVGEAIVGVAAVGALPLGFRVKLGLIRGKYLPAGLHAAEASYVSSSSISAQIFICVVTRSTTAEVQHNDMMMRTNVQNDLRHEMALEMWIVSVHEKSEQL